MYVTRVGECWMSRACASTRNVFQTHVRRGGRALHAAYHGGIYSLYRHLPISILCWHCSPAQRLCPILKDHIQMGVSATDMQDHYNAQSMNKSMTIDDPAGTIHRSMVCAPAGACSVIFFCALTPSCFSLRLPTNRWAALRQWFHFRKGAWTQISTRNPPRNHRSGAPSLSPPSLHQLPRRFQTFRTVCFAVMLITTVRANTCRP